MTKTIYRPLKYKGFDLFRLENSNGFYVSIERDGIYKDCTPYRNDLESAVETAKNLIDNQTRIS